MNASENISPGQASARSHLFKSSQPRPAECIHYKWLRKAETEGHSVVCQSFSCCNSLTYPFSYPTLDTSQFGVLSPEKEGDSRWWVSHATAWVFWVTSAALKISHQRPKAHIVTKQRKWVTQHKILRLPRKRPKHRKSCHLAIN